MRALSAETIIAKRLLLDVLGTSLLGGTLWVSLDVRLGGAPFPMR